MITAISGRNRRAAPNSPPPTRQRRSGAQHAQDLAPIGFEFFGADAADLRQIVQRFRHQLCHFGQRRVVKHHVGWQVVLTGDLGAPRFQRLETRHFFGVERQHRPPLAAPRRAGTACLATLGFQLGQAQQQLHSGDSYEVCLTDRFLGTGTFNGLTYYCALRTANPAPYAAYFRFTEFDDDVEIASASPERFLTVDDRRIAESKPIKGTSPRGDTRVEDEALSRALREDPKTRAENLMIVDLLRNDLGRVCTAGSVTVPKLMEVESYPAVHQLVSTIRGELRPDVSTLDAIRACFPGGSMTGAPKARTVEIIDALEAGARGIYSGAIGYLGFDGQADLSIAIRTLVRNGDKWSVGAGGAIVLDSDPHAEHEEKNLKADKLLRVLREMWDSPGKQERHAEPTKHVEPTEPTEPTKHAEQGELS